MALPVPPPDDQQLTLESTGFDGLMFWEKNRPALLAGAAIVIAAVVGAAFWIVNTHNSRLAAEALLARSTDQAGWQEVVAKYPKTPSAAAAYFLLAESLREEGKVDESTATYERFLAGFPKHPLTGGAKLGLAENLFLTGKSTEGVAELQSLVSSESASYAAPFALLIEGRVAAREGKLADARKIFSGLVSEYPQSLAARVAGAQLEEILPLIETKAP